jgi:hypothetical protein
MSLANYLRGRASAKSDGGKSFVKSYPCEAIIRSRMQLRWWVRACIIYYAILMSLGIDKLQGDFKQEHLEGHAVNLCTDWRLNLLQYKELPIPDTFQDEWSDLLRDALNTIGCLRLHNSIEKTEQRFFECIARFEETFTRYTFEQQMTLLFELGAVLAQLYIEMHSWHWVCATDKKKRRFFFLASSDGKFSMQPWTIAKACLQQRNRKVLLRQVLTIPVFLELREDKSEDDDYVGSKIITIETVYSLHRELARLAAGSEETRRAIKDEGLL